MIRSLPRLLRNGAFRTAAACALVFLLAAAVPEAFSLESPSFAQDNPNGRNGSPGGEEDGANERSTRHNSPPNTKDRDDSMPLSHYEFGLSLAILLSLYAILVAVRYTFKKHIGEKSEVIERISIVTILIMGALFLITSGYSDTHIAPAFALLGTIAGYLLGQIGPHKKM